MLPPYESRPSLERITISRQSPEEALDQALNALRDRLPHETAVDASVAAAARRLGTFGKRHGLSLGGLTIKELLHESRP